MTKKELRKVYLKRRMELSDAAYTEGNHQLCATLFSVINFSGFHVLHSFLPIRKNREVNTWIILERLKYEYPDIRISIPKINKQSGQLEHYYYEGPEQLATNSWEIPEPVKGEPTPVEKIDAVLVPLLTFDRQGHRVGYGRGFYDRFLSECNAGCLKIGLSFFEMEEQIDDVGAQDVAMNIVVTPKNIQRISNFER